MEPCKKPPLNKLANDYETAYLELIENKLKKARELEEFEEVYGKKLNKINEPEKTNRTLWEFVLNDVEKNTGPSINNMRDFKRFQKKKLAKIAVNTIQKKHKIWEEKAKAKIKMKKELSKAIAKQVYKEFWQTSFKIHKFTLQQQTKQKEKEDQKKRLDQLIKQQLRLSSQLAEVLVPLNATAAPEPGLELEPKAEASVELLGKRKTTLGKSRPAGVVIELKKTRKQVYSFARVIFDEKRLREESAKPKPRQNARLNPHSIFPPILLNGSLRSYQFIGLKWLLSLHQKKLNGILADEMGLGKTIQTIALLAYLAGELGIWGPHLVVVPTTLLMNWEMEFKRWAPGMKIFTYFGRLSERKEKRKGWSQINSFQVCITSYKIATLESKVFRRRKWYYLILDEAQQIKNSNSQTWQCLSSFQTMRRLLLTGTPLQNNLIELWSLLAFLIPERFESHADFKEWFSEPLQRALQSNQVINKEIIDNLHNILRPILLRRLKKDVEKELPKKSEVIIKVPLSMRQRYLYDEFINQDIKKSNNNDFLNLMNLLMHLRKTCNHPDLVKSKDVESSFCMGPLVFPVHSRFLLEVPRAPELVDHGVDLWTYQEACSLLPRRAAWQELLRERRQEKSQAFNEFNQEIGTAYLQQRHDAVLRQYDHYKKMVLLRIVTGLHLLQTVFRVEPAGQKVHAILERLGSPDFDHFIEQVFSQAEEFLVFNFKVLSAPPRLVVSPCLAGRDGLQRAFEAEKHLLDPVAVRVRRFWMKSIFHFPKQKNVIYDSGKLNRLIHILRDLRAKKHKCLIFTQVSFESKLRCQRCLISSRWPSVSTTSPTSVSTAPPRQSSASRSSSTSTTTPSSSSSSAPRAPGASASTSPARTPSSSTTPTGTPPSTGKPRYPLVTQDRCHRIGQTRDVTIYRLISEHTIEENILMKNIQKTQLDTYVMEKGEFNQETLSRKVVAADAVQHARDPRRRPRQQLQGRHAEGLQQGAEEGRGQGRLRDRQADPQRQRRARPR